jgi:ubiquinone/menaquinone biosynthesis C-methylase UbiE
MMFTSGLRRSARTKYRDILVSILSSYQKEAGTAQMVKVLDVGAGSCWLLNLLPRECMRVGLDLHAYHQSIDRTTFADFLDAESAHFVWGDATRLPFADDTIDIVYSNEFVSHVRSIDQTLLEQIRVLKRGGSILIMDANVLNPETFFDCLIVIYLGSRRAETKRGGMKWLLHRDEPFYEPGPMRQGARLVCWTDENIHSQYWWRRKLRSYAGIMDFKVGTFWSYLPISWFGVVANKILIVGKKL